ncbi:hypothetical protein FM111_07755 [Brevundimonas diminuta 3F5N]|uniref:Uncharacterized protein n=1 Tax=Brevundimonas diminuta 3F5N TaxID=1255603 RepID=A0A1R4FXL6_BREDI|nr:hypothetical protein [Brevundimonas diminuta]SJM60658.1 hypothetical protein FM111_07755 [Brevundimonas diminuta 3F5N]
MIKIFARGLLSTMDTPPEDDAQPSTPLATPAAKPAASSAKAERAARLAAALRTNLRRRKAPGAGGARPPNESN